MLVYYWKEYNDLTRWALWPAAKKIVEEELPDLYQAWVLFSVAKTSIDLQIDQLDS